MYGTMLHVAEAQNTGLRLKIGERVYLENAGRGLYYARPADGWDDDRHSYTHVNDTIIIPSSNVKVDEE